MHKRDAIRSKFVAFIHSKLSHSFTDKRQTYKTRERERERAEMERDTEVRTSKFKTICVFCGSSQGKKTSYQEAAIELGNVLVHIFSLFFRGFSFLHSLSKDTCTVASYCMLHLLCLWVLFVRNCFTLLVLCFPRGNLWLDFYDFGSDLIDLPLYFHANVLYFSSFSSCDGDGRD